MENKTVHSSQFSVQNLKMFLVLIFSRISSQCHASLWGHKMKHYSRINILRTLNSGEGIVTGGAGQTTTHWCYNGCQRAASTWRWRNLPETVKILQSSPEWSDISSSSFKIVHKENMEEDRQIQIVTQNTAGVINNFLWLESSNFFIQLLGPSFLTPDTITLLGVLSMIVLFIRKVRLSKSDVTLRTSGEAKIIILEEKGVLVPINFERKRHLKYSSTIQSKQYLILFIF